MDDETRAAFTTLEAHMNARFHALMTRMNDQFEKILDRLNLLGADFRNTKAFLIEDAIGMERRMFSLEDRITRLEKRDETP